MNPLSNIRPVMFAFYAFIILSVILSGCKKAPDPTITFTIKFDALQDRLDSNGQPTTTTTASAQTPVFNKIGINYFELSSDANTLLGTGNILLNTPDITVAGSTNKAVDFSQLKMLADGDVLVTMPLKNFAAGQYQYARLSVPYLNFDVAFNLLDVPFAGDFLDERGAVAAFLAPNTFITNYKVFDKTQTINGTKKRGAWSFETKLSPGYTAYNNIYNGQIPDSTITVVNPLRLTSPIPSGASVITGKFAVPLTITGTETQNISVVLSLSINKSFEWQDKLRKNGKWDIEAQANTGATVYEPLIDLGLRGLSASFENK